MRNPLNFNEARDAIMDLLHKNKKFKTDRERAIYLTGLKLGIVSGHELEDNAEVATFIKAIDLHLRVYDSNKKID